MTTPNTTVTNTGGSVNRVLLRKVLLVLAFVFFLIATLTAAGVITLDAWFLPAGLATWVLAYLVVEL